MGWDDIVGTLIPVVVHFFTDIAFVSQLGTFGRSKRKVDELTRVITESRRH